MNQKTSSKGYHNYNKKKGGRDLERYDGGYHEPKEGKKQYGGKKRKRGRNQGGHQQG